MSDWDTISHNVDIIKPISDADLDTFVNKASTNLPFFGKYFCHLEFSPKQIDTGICLKEFQKTVGVFNRQGGKTTTFSVYDAHELTFREYPAGSEDLTIIFAPIKDQSNLIFNKVEKIFKNNVWLNTFISKFQGGGLIRLNNGNELQAKTASPAAHIRGHSPKKIQLDESQDISDVKYYEDILPSGATTDAKVQEIGTPSKRNHFWKTWNQDPTYKKIMQIYTECPFISRSFVEDCRQNMSKAMFNQEFNCIWNVNYGAVWSIDTINKMCVLEDKPYPREPHTNYYAGIDVGKNPSQTVISVGKGVGNSLSQCRLLVINNPEDYISICNDTIVPLLKYEPLTCIDATAGSQGVVVHDMLSNMFREKGNLKMCYKLIPEDYHQSKFKSEMANDVEVMGENNRLKLLKIDSQKRQLIAFEKKNSKSGNDIFFSEELSDICQAVMLMVRAFVRHNDYGGKFVFASSGKTGPNYSAGDGGSSYSFTKDLPNERPEW
jgi:hypothetical protein